MNKNTQYYALEAGGKQLARYEVYQECKNIAGGGIPQPTNFKECTFMEVQPMDESPR